jgi:hypothetical protein
LSNSFTGDAFCGTLSFILAGCGTAGQSRRCEAHSLAQRHSRYQNARYARLAGTFIIAETSGNEGKLTKISCDISATRAPFSLQAQAFSRGRQFPNEDAHAFQHCHARQGTIGSSTPLTTTVIFYGRMTARHILPGIIGFGAKELSPTGISLLGRAVGLVSPQRKSLPLWPPKH